MDRKESASVTSGNEKARRETGFFNFYQTVGLSVVGS